MLSNESRHGFSRLLQAAPFWLLVLLAAFVVVTVVPDEAWAQVADLGESKMVQLRDALKRVAVVAIGIAGILAAVYISFGRQDGNERIGAVLKGGIVLSVVVSAVTYLAS